MKMADTIKQKKPVKPNRMAPLPNTPVTVNILVKSISSILPHTNNMSHRHSVLEHSTVSNGYWL